MPWHCISPPHSEDVIWAAQLLARHGITDPRSIKSRLEAYGWEIESIEAVINWVERYDRKATDSSVFAFRCASRTLRLLGEIVGGSAILLISAAWLLSSYILLTREVHRNYEAGDTLGIIGNVVVAALIAALGLSTIFGLVKLACKQRLKTVAVALVIGSIATTGTVIGTFKYGIHKSDEAAERKRALAQSVSVLPPGTEEAWTAFVDHHLSGAIQRQGDKVRVAMMGEKILDYGKTAKTIGLVFGSSEVEISPSTPYDVSCDPGLGASVDFGRETRSVMTDTHSITVPIYGLYPYIALMPIPRNLKEEAEPSLGVDIGSIAAQHLSDVLCARIRSYLKSIMTTETTP